MDTFDNHLKKCKLGYILYGMCSSRVYVLIKLNDFRQLFRQMAARSQIEATNAHQ